MKAIFTCTLRAGFNLCDVLPDDPAEDMVVNMLATGTLAEALDVQPPSWRIPAYENHAGGEFFIVYGKGLASGFEVFGPFPDEDTAQAFGEDARGEDDEWECFEIQPAA